MNNSELIIGCYLQLGGWLLVPEAEGQADDMRSPSKNKAET